MVRTFEGGVHPYYYKELVRDKNIIKAEIPSRLVMVLSQHVGAPSNPLVKVKDKVKRGQKIAEAQGFVSANLHSPVEGTVVAIKPSFVCSGAKNPSIVIEVEGLGEEERMEVKENPTPQEIKDAVKEAGIVGLGGAAFPTHVKLSPPPECPIDTIIINGCECEPYLSVDFRIMVEYPREVLEGVQLIKEAVGGNRTVIAIEDNKPEAVEAIKREISNFDGIEVSVLHTKYPQGSEKHLIKVITGREVPSGGLPFHVGVLVQNVQTALAIKRAVKDGIPLYERVISVTGQAIRSPRNFIVPVGMLASDILEQAGGLKQNAAKVIFGGPMTGMAIGSLDVPVMKGTSGIVALPKDAVEPYPETDVCIRCGRCIEACPARIMPNHLGTFGRLGMVERALDYNLMDCIECGACAYICPARRNLLQYIRYAKAKSRELSKK